MLRVVPYTALLNSKMIGPTPPASDVANSCPIIISGHRRQSRPRASRVCWLARPLGRLGRSRARWPSRAPKAGVELKIKKTEAERRAALGLRACGADSPSAGLDR